MLQQSNHKGRALILFQKRDHRIGPAVPRQVAPCVCPKSRSMRTGVNSRVHFWIPFWSKHI
jgi:hypothetical protein